MNRITDYIELRDRIVGFLNQYRRDSGMDSFVVGVSGGIDSAVASTRRSYHWCSRLCTGDADPSET